MSPGTPPSEATPLVRTPPFPSAPWGEFDADFVLRFLEGAWLHNSLGSLQVVNYVVTFQAANIAPIKLEVMDSSVRLGRWFLQWSPDMARSRVMSWEQEGGEGQCTWTRHP